MVRKNRRKSTVPMSWREFIKNCFVIIGKLLWSSLCLVRFLDPRRYIKSLWGHLYPRSSCRDMFSVLFRSGSFESSQHNILHWVQTQIPGMNVINFNTSWTDGIALCALVENLSPGACPRYDLLKSLHHVNNCRLALKLAHRHLNVPQDLITADDIINNNTTTNNNNTQQNEKLFQLISFIYKHFAGQKQPTGGPNFRGCVAKGSGLVAGVVHTRCKINVIVPFEETMDIVIIICGSGGGYHKELINTIPSRYPNKKSEDSSRAALLWRIGASQILKNPNFLKQDDKPRKIPFEYHSTADGQIEINYVPKHVGNYKVSIKWKTEHVKGSPFSVLIAESIEKLNSATNGKFQRKVIEPQQTLSKDIVITTNNTESCSRHNQQLQIISKQDSLSESSDSEKSKSSQKNIATAAAVLQRTSTLHRSLSRVSGPDLIPKQGTITRRRVLKQIVTKGGEEIVIHEAPPMDSLSSEEAVNEYKLTPPNKNVGKYRVSYLDTYPKSFDFEGSFESDSSIYKEEESLQSAKPQQKQAESLEYFAKSIISEILEDVLRHVRYKEYLFILEGKKKDFLSQTDIKYAPIGSKRFVFGRGKRFQSTGNLNIPTFERQFQVSPLTDAKDIPDAKYPIEIDKLELEGNLYKDKRHLRFSEPSLDSFSIDSEGYSTFSYDSRCIHDNDYDDDELSNMAATNSSDSSDCSPKDVKDVSSNERYENTGSSKLVTVHTQLKEETAENTHKRCKSLSSLSKINKPVFARKSTTDRKTTSEPGTPAVVDYDKRLLKRSLSHEPSVSERLTNKQISYDDDVFFADSPLKLLTSNSMQKSCVYISQKHVESDSVDIVSGGNCNTNIDLMKKKKLLMKQAWGIKRLHMSKSMPSLTHMITKVDYDDALVDNENSGSNPKLMKMATIEYSSTSSVSGNSPSESSSESKTSSRSTSSSESKTGSRRGSLARQHEVTTLQVLSEETSEDSKCDSHTESDQEMVLKESGGSRSDDSDDKEKEDDANEMKISIDNIDVQNPDITTFENNNYSVDQNNKESDVIRLYEVMPSTRIDKFTQVSYEEIKSETGWVRPMVYLLKRRIPIKINEVQSSIASVNSICCQSERNLNDNINENGIGTLNDQSKECYEESNELFNRPDQITVARQSTIDTVDSGIVDENTSKFSLRRTKKYLSGHRVISRNRYRGHIKLDPNLIKQDNFEEGEPHQHLRRYVSLWNDGKRSPLHLPMAGNDSNISEACGKIWRRHGFKGKSSVISKRVKFSRKIFVYQRSSSRSKTSSQSSKDSYSESGLQKDGESTMTKTFKVGFQKMEKKVKVTKSGELTSQEDSFSSIASPEVFQSQPRTNNDSTISTEDHINRQNYNFALPNHSKEEQNHKDVSLQSSLESDGFGVSSINRVDLLSELNSFRKLSSVSEVSAITNEDNLNENVGQINELNLQNNLISTDFETNLQILDNDAFNNENYSVDTTENNTKILHEIGNELDNKKYLDKYETFKEENAGNYEGDAINLAMPLGEDYISFTGLLELSNNHNSALIEEVDKMLNEEDDQMAMDGRSKLPDPEGCNALGPGLRYGQVGVKNNFQVHTRHAGNGCLGVSITGPRPHTVTETNVTYTGDDIYEVIYEVKHPGFYVITIKWSDFNIPESPFICKVTF